MHLPSRNEATRWIAVEGIFVAIFLAFLMVEIHNPRTPLHSGDQGLDSAMVNSLARADWFPPGDPWLSGWQLNYYYLGYLLQSVLARLTGTQSSIA